MCYTSTNWIMLHFWSWIPWWIIHKDVQTRCMRLTNLLTSMNPLTHSAPTTNHRSVFRLSIERFDISVFPSSMSSAMNGTVSFFVLEQEILSEVSNIELSCLSILMFKVCPLDITQHMQVQTNLYSYLTTVFFYSHLHSGFFRRWQNRRIQGSAHYGKYAT